LIKSYPKSPYVPEALLRQASLFLALKDTGSAKLILEKLIKEYPKSDQAQTARKKMKSL
jgi:TolA-binding protein